MLIMFTYVVGQLNYCNEISTKFIIYELLELGERN